MPKRKNRMTWGLVAILAVVLVGGLSALWWVGGKHIMRILYGREGSLKQSIGVVERGVPDRG